MIGQSMINVSSGATKRLSGIATALFLLTFIMFGSAWIERIPLAALIGVMFVVSEKTFEWGSLRLFSKIPKPDFLVGLLVTLMTVAFDLAIAVIAGVIVSALVFAWEHAKEIKVTTYIDDKGWKIYELEGSLFFASVAAFQNLFSPLDDPQDVVIEFRRAKVVGHSALEAIDTLAEKYKLAGTRLHLRHLSPDCLEVLEKAKGMIEVNVLEDPDYPVADNKLA
ncbi:MAG: SulP family inorganic anion transporter [Undibacterium sp.]|uniref:SulP family inorganic anion transporter n=1 Tax=Undibacterium sp. TaxID=1914977 RepID=UPI00271BCD58|nr:STAS domain-containing protein [Undibacterium sp.]MDO8654528.1 SulP family inorganic anion transporter [Undibacterium sp.]